LETTKPGFLAGFFLFWRRKTAFCRNNDYIYIVTVESEIPQEKIHSELAFKDAPVSALILRGAKLIADFCKRLPEKPGVYRMLDKDGHVLYVGKAKSLKNRVTSYARTAGHPNRIARMIAATANMEFIVTETETEALLLETNLIKNMKPRFNILMRDDKSFPYILLTTDHAAPALVKHRGSRAHKGKYFGPFASGYAVDRSIDTLQKVFQLRTCSDSIYASRTRPCLLYQIKRCSAPCTGEINLENYGKLVDAASNFLRGRMQGLREHLAEKMEAESAGLNFEKAAEYRDRLEALAAVTTQQGINLKNVEEADVFAISHEGGEVCVQIFFIRNFQNWGNRPYFLHADASFSDEEVLQDFIMQFYLDKPCPACILTSHTLPEADLLSKALSQKSEYKVTVTYPQAGEKRHLISRALQNAKESLARRMAESATQNKLLNMLTGTFELEAPPKRIEVYDNSHIMGAQAVGAMIVAGPEGFIRNQYRKWTIKNTELNPGDDYGMMREVFTRRFSRLLKESGENAGIPWPDLVLIDGGKGQLEAARGILAELNITERVPLVAIAKGIERDAGREQFFVHGRAGFQLPPRDPVLYFVQRLRDEAHRFVIGAHKAKRAKIITANPLDEVAGIGPTRKRALMRHFGTAKAVSGAALEDLLKVPGISAAMAKQIWSHFNEG
jgi:excinuclease ABC subunit C